MRNNINRASEAKQVVSETLGMLNTMSDMTDAEWAQLIVEIRREILGAIAEAMKQLGLVLESLLEREDVR
jgi:hypothetical protein